jgi:hypothetical protein
MTYAGDRFTGALNSGSGAAWKPPSLVSCGNPCEGGSRKPKSITLHVKVLHEGSRAIRPMRPKPGEMRGSLRMSSDHNLSNPGSYQVFVARTSDWLMARAAAHPTPGNGDYALPRHSPFLDDSIVTVGFDKRSDRTKMVMVISGCKRKVHLRKYDRSHFEVGTIPWQFLYSH